MATPLWSIGLVLVGCVIGSLGPLMFKLGAKNFTRNFKKLITNYHLYLGGFFYALSSVFFIVALRAGELSVLYPLVATTYIWVSLLSVRYLRERMNAYKWIGITTIIVGALFIGLGS